MNMHYYPGALLCILLACAYQPIFPAPIPIMAQVFLNIIAAIWLIFEATIFANIRDAKIKNKKLQERYNTIRKEAMEMQRHNSDDF